MQFIFLSAISIVLPEFIWLFRSAQLSSALFAAVSNLLWQITLLLWPT